MSSQHYEVTWTLDVEADSPREAAELALAFQHDQSRTATFFIVEDDLNTTYHINLENQNEGP